MSRQLPTSGKLVAALCFAATAYVAAGRYVPLLPDGFRTNGFEIYCAVLGLVVGWLVMGRLVGVNLRGAAGRGLSTAVWLFFWTLLAFSIYEMLMRSLDKRYRSPMDAVGGAIEVAIFFAKTAMNVEVLGVLALGGMISGVLAELANRFWR